MRNLLKDNALVVQIVVMPAWGIMLVMLDAEAGSARSDLMLIYPGAGFCQWVQRDCAGQRARGPN